MKKEIILIGGGGHCKSIIDVIEAADQFTVAGIVDVPDKKGSTLLGYPVIAHDLELPDLARKFRYFFITIGQIKDYQARRRQYEVLKNLGLELPVLISPYARVSRHATLGEGTVVMHHALVNADASVGVNCIINSGAVIEHDARVGQQCHVSTGAIINGGAELGEGCFMGSRSVMYQGVHVKSDSLIAAGSVVTRSLTEGRIFSGNPAEKIR